MNFKRLILIFSCLFFLFSCGLTEEVIKAQLSDLGLDPANAKKLSIEVFTIDEGDFIAANGKTFDFGVNPKGAQINEAFVVRIVNCKIENPEVSIELQNDYWSMENLTQNGLEFSFDLKNNPELIGTFCAQIKVSVNQHDFYFFVNVRQSEKELTKPETTPVTSENEDSESNSEESLEGEDASAEQISGSADNESNIEQNK